MKGLTSAVLLGALLSLSVEAATLTPTINEQMIGASISDIALPDALAKDLASGFENKVLIRVQLFSPSENVNRADTLITIKYDLWDERFVVRQIAAGKPPVETVLRNSQEVIAFLAAPKVDSVFSIEKLQKGREFVLQAELLINPIEREKIERLREWVATHSTPNQALGNGVAFTPKPNDLFNRIFEQYTSGADLAAAWSLTIRSQPFKLDQLIKEKISR